MFSRVAKSVVRSLGSRQIHINEKNFKIALIDGAGEINQTLSQILENSAKLNALALYDVAVNRPLPNYNLFDEQPFEPNPSKMLTMTKKSYSDEGSHSNAVINAKQTDNNHQENNGRHQVEKLVEALYRLPIAEETPAFNTTLIPTEELMPKAGNVCGRMRSYARVLGDKDSSNVRTWQRGYATVTMCFSDLMYPWFTKHDLNFIPKVKISKRHRSIKRMRKTRRSSCSALVANENNCQSLSLSLLNHFEKSARGLTKKFRNIGLSLNIEPHCRAVEKLPVLINREAVSFNRDGETMTDDTLNVVEQENWIQRTCSKIKSIFPDLHAKVRLHSTASDSYCSENVSAVNQVIPFSDIISDSAILFASKDCEDGRPKINIRRKIQEFCIQRKRTLKKNRDKNDICKKRERCVTMKRKGEREKICERKRSGCSERRKRTSKRQNAICKGRKSSCDKESVRDCRKTCERKVEVQEDPCKQKKDDISRIKEAPCRRQCSVKQETSYELHELHDSDPCRVDKKEKIKKKEEIKKPDCTEIKKVDPCEKKPCPTVKKAEECSEDDAKRKGR